MSCGDACIPTCSDTAANCSAPFLSSMDVGAIYYQVSLCCGSTWMEERSGDAFISVGPMMVWLIATPLLKVLKRMILRALLAKMCGVTDEDEEQDTKKTQKNKESGSKPSENTYSSIFTTINGIVQLFCGAIALWTYFFRRNFHVHEVNSQCPASHCHFLIFISAFLYKPFIIPVYQTVTAATNVIQDAYAAKSSMRSLLFTCHGCLLIPYLVGLFLIFLLPMFVYSLILLVLFFPIYVTILLFLTIPASIGAYILTRNDFAQEARVYSAVNSGYVLILAYLYSTLCVSKLYYGCGWQYTARTLFDDSFATYTLSSGLAWPTASSKLAQGTLAVSLSSGVICSTLETLVRLSCRQRRADTARTASSPTMELTIRSNNRV